MSCIRFSAVNASFEVAYVGNLMPDLIANLMASHPQYFTFQTMADGFVEIRDFQTTGVVAFAKGEPFSHMSVGRQTVNGQRVQVREDYLQNARTSLASLVAKL
jgi:hypothetical protein